MLRRHGHGWTVSVAALVVLGSGACTSTVPEPGRSGGTTTPGSTSATNPTSTGAAPSVSASPPGSDTANSLGFDSSHQLTDAEAMTLYRQQLAQTAKDMNLKTVPKVAFVRFIDPAEITTTTVSCLRDLGLPAVVNAQGNGFSIPGDVPDSQKEFVNETAYTCSAMYPSHPQFDLPPSRESLGKQYDWNVAKLTPCYRAQGFPVPDPPTKQVWVANYPNDPWFPDQFIPSEVARDGAKRAELDRKCPLPQYSDLIEHPPVIKK